MIEIAVNNLAAATGARTVTGEVDRVCRGCVIDSRQVEEGTIFVAFPVKTSTAMILLPVPSSRVPAPS